ncbi:NADP-dependent malic enzyme [Lecanosticta acicola]|uniref:Malic enzyme n=1 Tax=Lecanosticta acicola TaxID=111012 RepID=A0AAI8YYA2_9PEZI|nr:NADP-dependent malic enzyme [Lecanosticta acicola]
MAHSRNTSKNGNLPAANIKHSAAPHHMPERHVHPAPADYDTTHPVETRKYLRTYGLTPPGVDTFETQSQRAMAILNAKKTPIEKYQYLSVLRNSNNHLFYRLLADNIKELTPLIYTPTVGEACQRWSELYTQPEGLYLSFEDKGHLHTVIQNWPHDVEITVVTDGSRILGLGDLGINGMGIPVGKLSLYTACAGIHPMRTLPLCLDLGTSNEEFRNDPLYLGSRRPKVSPEEEKEFLDEMMAALTERWPSIVIQYEDFKNPFPSLERYQDTYTMFNDDIQGTGAVILGGFINAVKQSGVAPQDQRAVFLGAGSAGVGVAKQLTEFFIKEGLSEEEAKKRFWLVDSQGLVTLDRPGRALAEHKVYFARDDNEGQQFQTLEDVVEYVKPTILMGLSTIGGAFTPKILERMAELNDKPVIFPLSNPSSKSECTFEEAIKYTKGRCLFASGSPFPELEWEGKKLEPGQGNNMYVFPGIGLGAILSKAVNVTQNMIYASAEALSTSLLPEEVEANWLYPDISRIREVSVTVTRGVIRAAQKDNMDRELALRNISDEELDEYIRQRMYDPFTEHTKIDDEVKDLAGHLRAMTTNGSDAASPAATNGSRRSTITAGRPGNANGLTRAPESGSNIHGQALTSGA